MQHSPVRVRFAPSPTGMPHLGSLRTALFNFLFARHSGGAFLLRIEDTDVERSRDEYRDAMETMLAWAGITHDEGIVVQSQRLLVYREYAEQLIRAGRAYRCRCSTVELQQRTMRSSPDGTVYGHYDGRCRSQDVSADEVHVIRFALPDVDHIVIDDVIKGQLSFARDVLDDFIIIRSDGGPMYNFAVVVDDAYMRISHVIRGEEHLVNTPKQLLLYQAFGWQPPCFAHLPLILGADGSKLSKRDEAANAMDYIRKGFLPQALNNYIARLGWSHGDRELFFSLDELASLFTLEGITTKGALFDWKKLLWVNQQHLMRHTPSELLTYARIWLGWDATFQLPGWSAEQVETAVRLYLPRVHTLGELIQCLRELHDGPQSYEDPVCSPEAGDQLGILEGVLMEHNVVSSDQVKDLLARSLTLPLGQVGPSIRVALTGRKSAPGIGDLISVLGGKESAYRLQKYRTMLL